MAIKPTLEVTVAAEVVDVDVEVEELEATSSSASGRQPLYGARHFQSLTEYDFFHDDAVEE